MKNVIFIAPPAAGKGTQSSKLMEIGYKHISTGDILREEIAMQTPIGKSIEKLIGDGHLVSDEIVYDLIKKRINNEHLFIIDGYPRTIKQAEMLDQLFKKLDINNYEVVYLDIPMEEAIKRTLGRLTCECGSSYNIYYDDMKPLKDGICDKCGHKLTKRDDDNEASFKVRFETFEENIKPIKEFYKNINKLNIVNALNDSDVIATEIKEILK